MKGKSRFTGAFWLSQRHEAHPCKQTRSTKCERKKKKNKFAVDKTGLALIYSC